jgi:hypothetical protein
MAIIIVSQKRVAGFFVASMPSVKRVKAIKVVLSARTKLRFPEEQGVARNDWEETVIFHREVTLTDEAGGYDLDKGINVCVRCAGSAPTVSANNR